MSQAAPLVTIITVVFNGEKHLEKTIQSVIQQTYPNIEYIVIDGGSTDGTIDIIKKYGQQISQWVSEKDKGIADAFNKGIQKATGSIIGLINADDWYEPDAVQTAVQHLKDADIVYGKLNIWKNDTIAYTVAANHSLLPNEMTVNHPTVFVKKKWYDEHGLFRLQFRCAMDYDVMLRFYTRGAVFVYTDTVMANMRLEGFSDVNWKVGCKETLAIKNEYIPQKRTKNYLYYLRHVNAIRITRWMNNSPLKKILQWYRRKWSKIEKS